ncbi:type IV pilin protein [Marilutibacter aestuarii]|uniref:Type IV pilin protein n=1 Tax=Marilutibacter aestuarii TaxID=1706195 RepID=A0A508AV89_9GAMM|nr:type IV pilin protein [Lysobacter aestuarii]TQD51548.1 type IV pilin protein [Lysobacter aestuarii]
MAKISRSTVRNRKHVALGRRVGAAGFTLIELMIAVLVIAVLAAIAYPAYQNHTIKTRRATAGACALEASQFMERFYTTNLRYDQDQGGTAVALPALQCMTDMGGQYAIQLAASTASTYSIRAVPQGRQATKDTKCGTLTIDHTGQKTVSVSGTPVAECW